jgi:hypothetical protein
MKQCILFLIASMIFVNLKAQERGQMIVMKFISAQDEVILLYNNDIEIYNELSFKITDGSKVDKLKTIEVKEAYFVCKCCGDDQVFLQNILASSVPISNLYILVLGKNKIHFGNGLLVECSPPLIQKIQRIIK